MSALAADETAAETSALRLRSGTRSTRAPQSWLLVTGVVLAAFNLRTAVTSVGALLDEVRDGLGMPSAVAGLLTTLPVLCFAVLGGMTPMAVRRFGPRAVMTAALVTMSIGLLARASVDNAAVFLIASALALTGGAVGNVTVPSVVKQHFGDRVGAMTTAYSTALAVGTMTAALLTVPVEQLFDRSWQVALGVWAIPALLATVPWLAWRDGELDADRRDAPRLRGLWRTRLAWTMTAFFAGQAMLAYIMMGWLAQMMRDHGYSAARAGFMLGMFTAISIPVSMTVPVIAARMADQRRVMYALLAMYPIGLGGLWLGSAGWSMWLWIVTAGIAVGGTFPLLLTLFALRARTAAGTAALSAFSQSIGYLIAGVGPLLVGVLYGATDGWTAPFLLMFVVVAAQIAGGGFVARPGFIEDELAAVRR